MSAPKQYRKKPVVIEAMRWDGNESAMAIEKWSGHVVSRGEDFPDLMSVETLEGDMNAAPGDYIIKGVQGEFYPCKPDIFEATYEAVDA